MDKRYRDIIAKEFRDWVLNTVRRLDNAETNRPFHAALLSDEALFWSRFERSFSTSFGQRAIEEISKVVAVAGGASDSSRQKVTNIGIDSAVDGAIKTHLNSLRTGKRATRWETTIEEISKTTHSGDILTIRIISDLWWIKGGIDHYMSIKTVKPNIDQTAVAKQDLGTALK
ncbi:MAG: TdeIII family type II restriction endonuclease [Gracilibacteraceae bacterium]|nr:TdeIII family type II restriction endonuclease [Gracilibacteraceae bacterium]